MVGHGVNQGEGEDETRNDLVDFGVVLYLTGKDG